MVFVIVFLLIRIMCPHHSDQMFQRSQDSTRISRVPLWGCFLNAFVIVFFFVFVFVFVFFIVFFIVKSCLLSDKVTYRAVLGTAKTKENQSKCESDVTAQLILNLSFFLLPMTLKAKENTFKSEIDMIAPGSSDSTVEEEIEDCQ